MPPEKREERRINRTQAAAFWNVLETCNLLDMGFLGSKFTWINNKSGGWVIMERLHRAFCNPT